MNRFDFTGRFRPNPNIVIFPPEPVHYFRKTLPGGIIDFFGWVTEVKNGVENDGFSVAKLSAMSRLQDSFLTGRRLPSNPKGITALQASARAIW